MTPRCPAPARHLGPPAALRYTVEVADVHAHLWRVTLAIDRPAPRQRVSLPVWIPGSYLVREFAQHLQRLQAAVDGHPVPLRALDKNTWQAELDAEAAARTLTLQYEVYAFDPSVRAAYLDARRGFFNATSLCLRVHGREDEPHALTLAGSDATRGWRVATALRPWAPAAGTRPRRAPGWRWAAGDGFGTYLATDYDELADSPVEMGDFWCGDVVVRGVPHRFVVSGAVAGFDGERLLRDTAQVCEAAMALWHGPDGAPPIDRYLFLLNATQDGYGGLEHRHSTALVCARTDLPLQPLPGPRAPDQAPAPLRAGDGYTTLLGLISHEYFHTWNVKRLRPREFTRYDYDRENPTELLWFFEGFTSYYDDLLLLRAGLIDQATHLQLLAKSINHVLQTPGRQVQSVAQASWDAWIKYYRVQENTPNATVSYYAKGALVALCLDLTLRIEGRTTLDDVMRALWQRCAGGPMREADLRAVLRRLAGRDLGAELDAWVHGTDELPLRPLLERHGVRWIEERAPLAQQLGLRVDEASGIRLRNVLRGGAAEAAGLAAGDEWLAVERAGEIWRVRRLDDVALHARGLTADEPLVCWVARDGRVLRCPLQWPAPATTVQLQPAPAEARADLTPRETAARASAGRP
ncbi:M61 glycyl aminopeptidase [Tepidimonas fonticaldi]|uniref:M61 glycyl aminopeptidase n=1 Tax=Tepidimonas fonticaldi TaxID=1101373 RepID=A0A554XQ10_9BURK|nr:M61 family metallopeptidase [Tepidimonas fonticaldi]TSE37919.1 M61 glycyl aminopeptidase [Tepidimonas fonticaldi]